MWTLSHRADPSSARIADRHYNRQKIGSPQFVPPGRCVVLHHPTALWVTSWPFAEYVKHEWPGAWINSCFRREAGPVASEMIREALAATLSVWSTPPSIAAAGGPVCMVTFIDRSKVKHKRDFGRCCLRAGFRVIGETKGGLLALGIGAVDMPAAEPPLGAQESMFTGASQ